MDTTSSAAKSLKPEMRAARVSHLQSSRKGPADISARVSSHSKGGMRQDDGPYFINDDSVCRCTWEVIVN